MRDQPLTTGTLCGDFVHIGRGTYMQHVRVLDEAGELIVERCGRERWNHVNAMPIHNIHVRWIGPHAAAVSGKLAGFNRTVEAKAAVPGQPVPNSQS
jgi:hypothetical protein